jgi:C-terminal processing protease CtpA/Prc
LCAALTTDLRAVCPDKHLRLKWSAEPTPVGYSDPEALALYWQEARLDNYGLYRVERLAGNVGYIDLRAVDEAEETADTFAAAMAVVAHTGALLLDLRANTGGAPSGVAFVCSYFFSPEPVHLNDVYTRATDTRQQYWTYPHLPGARYLDRPVWALVGPGTFSGGEEIAYNLQQLGRAILVGETTVGGAHPVDEFPVTDGISIRVPVARSINAVTGTNWEGQGVTPDIAVPAPAAFDTAYTAALQSVVTSLVEPVAPYARRLMGEVASALAHITATGA